MSNFRADIIFVVGTAGGFGLLVAQPNLLAEFFSADSGADSLSPWRIIPLPLWMVMALVAGFIVPIYTVLRHRSLPSVCWSAVGVMMLFAIQIGLEIGARKLAIGFAAPVIGAVFTLWRLWQLAMLRSAVPPHDHLTRGMIAASLIFWFTNLAFLVLTFGPRLIS
jgi:hypothetical protein